MYWLWKSICYVQNELDQVTAKFISILGRHVIIFALEELVPEEFVQTQHVAFPRIHVERAINAVENFQNMEHFSGTRHDLLFASKRRFIF